MFVHRLFGASVKNSVVPDDALGAQLAVEHLLKFGHQHIAHIAGPQGWHSARQRLESYQTTLSSWHIALDPTLIIESDWEFEGGVAAAEQLLAMSQRPTAIFAANDMMALGAIAALQQAGLRVPQDIALVGYDNRDFSRVFHPKLTTVSLPTYRIGQKAAELLWLKLQGEAADLEEVKICGQLYIRESCGADKMLRTQDKPDVETTVRHRLTGKQPERD